MAPLKRIARVNKADIINVFKCTLCNEVFQSQPIYDAHMELHNDDLPYACDLCQYRCRVKKYLSRHKRKVHTKANGPACTVCGKVFHYSSSLRNHMRVHTGERPFHCEVCNKSFGSTYCLSMHRLIHTNEKPFECKFCDYACRDSSTLRRHEERHLGITKLYPCQQCKMKFNAKFKLRMHVDEVHYGLDMRQIACEHCGRRFKTKAGKNTHVKAVHERSDRVQCEICDRLLSKNNMNNHLKSHVDIRPFSCSYKNCHKQFKYRSTLKKHALIHYPELYFQCDLCDSRFVRQVRLRDHQKWHMTNGYTCDYCGGSFTTKTYLQLHITKKHIKAAEKFICDQCDSVHFSRQSIILHLRYGHGHRNERNCRICGDRLQNNADLSEHYLKRHKVRYVVIKKAKDEVTVKNEPDEEVLQEFDFDYEVQKTEIEENEPNALESNNVLSDCNNMLEVNISPNIVNTENMLNAVIETANNTKTEEYIPEYVDTESTLAYSEKVLEEDLSRSVTEGKRKEPESTFEEFFLKEIVDKSKKKKNLELGKEIVDKNKLVDLQKTIDKMLKESRIQKISVTLEKMRVSYNKRIEMANKIKQKKEPTHIKYFKKSQSVESSENNKSATNTNNDDKSDDDNIKLRYDDTSDDQSNASENVNGNEESNDELKSRPKRVRKKINNYVDDYLEGDKIKKNSKLTFDGHECYVCFKVFKTKDDLKSHCKEHFDICNEKMLKKCPFCGYVTNLNIKRHIENVHNVNISYDYAHISEKPNSTGSKYVFEIDKDCELEIIPSISNLNKIAGMKVDEQRRKDNNLFIGKTKLVKKGGGWVVEKEAVGLNSNNLLPVFTDEDYKKLKLTGDSYFDRLQQLGFLAKRRGAKMLYPCEGCEKICQSLAALKLHNRKHEDNPKQYRPKVWVNRHIEYKTKSRKKIRNKSKSSKENPRSAPIMAKRKKINYAIENRYAAPQPVKNNHKCDRSLIEFYKNHIRGKDIEFWQFLKIFNKINRENVNDFDDLVNRDDVHFGIHNKDELSNSDQNKSNNTKSDITNHNITASNSNNSVTDRNKYVTKRNKQITNRNKPISNRNPSESILHKLVNLEHGSTHINTKISQFKSVANETSIKTVTTGKPVLLKKAYKIKSKINKKVNRVIIISKSENMRRNAIKNEMRQRLANNNM